MTALSVRGLHVDRGQRPILTGVDLEVPAGEVTALLGPNGAGKSTLVLGLTGLLPVASGTAHFGDLDIVGKRPEQIREHGLAAVPEGHRVLTRLTVRDNILAARGSAERLSEDEALTTAVDAFPELDPLMPQLAGGLSGGQQQMLAFAQALIAKPDVLLIDEMSLGLAPVIVHRLVSVVAETAKSGIGVLLIEQYANVALGVSSHAYVMHRGAISYSGSAQDLLDQPEVLHAAYFGDEA